MRIQSGIQGEGRASQHGFTMVELLVVIAIIAMLVSILLPVLGTVRENGRRAACQSNLKGLGQAAIMYTQDYDETWLGLRTGSGSVPWGSEMYPYVRNTQVFQCPSDTTPANSNTLDLPISYSLNMDWAMGPDDKGQHPFVLSASSNPSLTVTFVEVRDAWTQVDNSAETCSPNGNGYGKINGGCPPAGWGSSTTRYATGFLGGGPNLSGADFADYSTGCTDQTCGGLAFDGNSRHLGGSNFAFGDGHVKWLSGNNVSVGYTPGSSNCAQGTYTASNNPCFNYISTLYMASGTAKMTSPSGSPFEATFSPR